MDFRDLFWSLQLVLAHFLLQNIGFLLNKFVDTDRMTFLDQFRRFQLILSVYLTNKSRVVCVGLHWILWINFEDFNWFLAYFENYPYRDSPIFRQLPSCHRKVGVNIRSSRDARGRGGAPLLRQCYCFLNTWGLWSANRRPRETIPRGKEWKEIPCFPDNKEPC